MGFNVTCTGINTQVIGLWSNRDANKTLCTTSSAFFATSPSL
jgi:hypothetical protein